jgi:hypothetical protein
MAVLTPDKVNKDIKDLLDYLEKSQWKFIPDFLSISGLKIMTRDDLRKIDMSGDMGVSKSSGSTGEPVSVGKTYKDYVWYVALSIREFRWLKWDFKKNIAIINASIFRIINGTSIIF